MAIYRIFKERVFEPEAVTCMARAYKRVGRPPIDQPSGPFHRDCR